MKIIKLRKESLALPLGWIPEGRGGNDLDYNINEEVINNINKKFHIKDTLGEGMWGVAYKISNNRVLKLTLDTQEIDAALMIKGSYGPFVEVYEVGMIDTSGNLIEINAIEGVKVLSYYVVKDLVNPLDEYTAYLIDNSDMFAEELELNQENPDLYPGKLEKCEAVDDYFNDIGNYMLTDVYRSDNLGFDNNGNIVCFDPRVSDY